MQPTNRSTLHRHMREEPHCTTCTNVRMSAKQRIFFRLEDPFECSNHSNIPFSPILQEHNVWHSIIQRLLCTFFIAGLVKAEFWPDSGFTDLGTRTPFRRLTGHGLSFLRSSSSSEFFKSRASEQWPNERNFKPSQVYKR